MDSSYSGDEALNTWSKKLCKSLFMLLLAANFGVYVRVLWFCMLYVTPFYSVLLGSNMIPRCSWDLHWETLALSNTKGRSGTFFNFRLKITYCVCLLGSGLKPIFQWNAQLLAFFKYLFSSFAEVFMSSATLRRDVSSANNFALKNNHHINFYINK